MAILERSAERTKLIDRPTWMSVGDAVNSLGDALMVFQKSFGEGSVKWYLLKNDFEETKLSVIEVCGVDPTMLDGFQKLGLSDRVFDAVFVKQKGYGDRWVEHHAIERSEDGGRTFYFQPCLVSGISERKHKDRSSYANMK